MVQFSEAVLCLRPHCSYKLPPLDVRFMKPLSNYYENWSRTQNVFQESDFLPATATEIPLHNEGNENDFNQINHRPLGDHVHQTPEKAMIDKSKVKTTPLAHLPIRNINNDSSPLPQCLWMLDSPAVQEKSPNKEDLGKSNISPLASHRHKICSQLLK